MGVFNDEFDGVGGTYVVGADGKRRRVPEEGAEAQPAAQPSAAPEVINPAQPAEPTINGDDHGI